MEVQKEKSLPVYLTMAQLRDRIVSWSEDTIRRKIKENGFPAIQDEGGRYIFPTKLVLEWFKRREVKAG